MHVRWLLGSLCGLLVANLGAVELSGYVAMEGRAFFESPLDPRQSNQGLSFVLEPEWAQVWDDGRQTLVFRPFARWDQHDHQRSHWDIRELQWIYAGDGWEARLGVGKVYWGVTEAWHLVDVINQTDLVENPDGEQKLGQPMLKLSLEKDWGILDFFVLPYFRERTFPGVHGRLRSQPRVEPDLAQYEASSKQRHVDLAARWSHYLGEWDLGFSVFHGTGRDPLFILRQYRGEWVLAPFYEQVTQVSIDAQATLGEWLWKFEGLYRRGMNESFYAATGGFEYTQVGIFDSASDLGWVAEWLWDERGDEAAWPFNHDVFLGWRWSLNDEQSSELLAGVIVDWKHGGTLLNIEASRRLGERYKLSMQLRSWLDIERQDLQYPFRHDDYVQLELARYF